MYKFRNFLKARRGEVPMASRAITPEVLWKIFSVNHETQNRIVPPYAPRSRSDAQAAKYLGGRTRRLLTACYNIAFWCLLRGDEVLKIRLEHLEVVSENCIKLHLPFRKTHQFGGESRCTNLSTNRLFANGSSQHLNYRCSPILSLPLASHTILYVSRACHLRVG
jgi:hypothetical protein